MTMDAYHHGNNPPPYSLNDHVTPHEPILVPIPPYEVCDIRTPPPPYRRNDGPEPPSYEDSSNITVDRENIAVATENITISRSSVVADDEVALGETRK